MVPALLPVRGPPPGSAMLRPSLLESERPLVPGLLPLSAGRFGLVPAQLLARGRRLVLEQREEQVLARLLALGPRVPSAGRRALV